VLPATRARKHPCPRCYRTFPIAWREASPPSNPIGALWEAGLVLVTGVA